MRDYQRQMFLKLSDGHLDAMPILHQVHQLKISDQACMWLLKNKIIGQKLVDMYKYEFLGSNLKFIQFLTSQVYKSPEYAPRASDLIN